jgi:hypothetical protein
MLIIANISDSNFISLITNYIGKLPGGFSKIASEILAIMSMKFNLFSYHFPVNFDLKNKEFFTYSSNEKYIFDPRNIERCKPKNIFSLLRKKDHSYQYIYSNNLNLNFSDFEDDIIFYYNSILDFYGHKYGISSKIYINKFKEIFNWINKLVEGNQYDIIVFSDHGMTQTYNKFHPLKIINKLGLKVNKDLILCLDSTIVKIWFISKKALKLKDLLIEEFDKSKKGHIIKDSERKKYGLNFKNRYFGDLLFLANPHIEISPNFFVINPFKMTPSLHGYNPKDPFSYGIFY